MTFDIVNKRLSDEEFFKIRNEEVLVQWDTGKNVANLDENIAIAKELSQGKNYALTLAEHKQNGTNIFEPQFGQALTEYMIEGLTHVEANSDMYPHGVWTIFSDTYTRKCDFPKAAAGMMIPSTGQAGLDSVPFIGMPGEGVIKRNTMQRLERFLSSSESSSAMGIQPIGGGSPMMVNFNIARPQSASDSVGMARTVSRMTREYNRRVM